MSAPAKPARVDAAYSCTTAELDAAMDRLAAELDERDRRAREAVAS